MNVPLVIPGVLPLALAVWLWARWLGRRSPQQAKRTAILQLTAVVVPLVTVSSSAYLLRNAFESLHAVSAAQRASEIVQAITWSMRITQGGILLLVGALLLLAIMHSRLSNDSWRGPPLGGQQGGAGDDG